MNREAIERIVRTALVTHNARFGMPLIELDVLIGRIADAMEQHIARSYEPKTTTLRSVLESAKAKHGGLPAIENLVDL